MVSSSLVGLLQLLESNAILVWLDGGWGVDALLQTQTRAHKDVDIMTSTRLLRRRQVGDSLLNLGQV